MQDLQQHLIPEPIVAADIVEGIEFVRGISGTWYYKQTGLPVPGASDRTLADEYEPRFIALADGEPEQVLIAASTVDAHPESLSWCKEIGSVVRDAEGSANGYIVPVEEWKAHSEKPLGIAAPEFSSDPFEARLAQVERDYRDARRAFNGAAYARLAGLRAATDNGVTRTRAAEILAVSSGRVTQLLQQPKLAVNEVAILEAVATSNGGITAEQLAKIGESVPEITSKEPTAVKRLASLGGKGLLDQHPAGGWMLSEAGLLWYEMHKKDLEAGSDAKSGGDPK